MRRLLPLVSGLALALVASTALAADGPSRRDDRRTDLLASHRQVNPEIGVRTDNRAQLRTGVERSVLLETAVPVVSVPDQPMLPTGAGDQALTVSVVSITEAEGAERRSIPNNWVVDGIRIDEDPVAMQVLEARGRRLPALVAHGLNDTGEERLFQLR